MKVIERWQSRGGKYWVQVEETIVQVRTSEFNVDNVPVYNVRYDNGNSTGLTLEAAQKKLLEEVSYCSSKLKKVM